MAEEGAGSKCKNENVSSIEEPDETQHKYFPEFSSSISVSMVVILFVVQDFIFWSVCSVFNLDP